MQPLGVHHVSINVSDTAAAIDFYTRVLGLTVRTDRPNFPFGGAWLDLGAQQVHLIEAGVPPALGQHFAIHIADLDQTVADIRGMGVEIADPKTVGTGRQTFVHDPSGNLVELHQPATRP